MSISPWVSAAVGARAVGRRRGAVAGSGRWSVSPGGDAGGAPRTVWGRGGRPGILGPPEISPHPPISRRSSRSSGPSSALLGPTGSRPPPPGPWRRRRRRGVSRANPSGPSHQVGVTWGVVNNGSGMWSVRWRSWSGRDGAGRANRGASASQPRGREEARGALAARCSQQAPPGRTQSRRRRRRGGEGRPRAGPNPEGRAAPPGRARSPEGPRWGRPVAAVAQ